MTSTRPWLRLAVATLALLASTLPLQAASGARPVSFSQSVLSDERIEHHFLGFVDVEYLKFEDELSTRSTDATRVPFRVADPVPLHLGLQDGTRETLPDGGTLWRLRVTSPGAVFVSFMLSHVSLPPGAELRFYSVDRDYQDGPYTSAINNRERRFGSPAIPGDSAVIELYAPAVVAWDPTLEVESVSHGYRDFNRFDRVPFRNGLRTSLDTIQWVGGGLGACEVDVNCSVGSQWQADKRAVARTYDGRYLCTGSLINNARQDCRNLFLTAAHCVSRSQTAAGMVFYWNYENSTCGGSNAPTNQTSTGSSLRATNSSSDFTLLELNSAPNSAYNVYYAGFSRSASAPASAVAIHHPTGAAKKISFENDAVQDGGGFSGGWGNDHWRIVGWDVGTTEGGSSGCPLFNANHQIVGQLHGGTADCSGGWDEFGKLSVSWTAGLSSWLDPNNSGLTSIGGKESSTCSGGGGSCLPGGTACSTNSQCCSGACAKKTKICR
ncbi:MAG TPA: trypsin-like peptidase domain-containing protein [Thermoanaerobaculia bacterium]